MAEQKSEMFLYFHVHMVSDSTGETLLTVMRASAARFCGARALEHLYTLVRSEDDMRRTIENIDTRPGVVLYTITNFQQRKILEAYCRKNNIPAISVLDQVLSMLGRYLGANVTHEIAAQHNLGSSYYNRISALDFSMAHDDGQNAAGLKDADIILLGISRTSKTPTSIYLANRGYRTGNIPLVPGSPLPALLDSFSKPFVVGLVASPERITQIRTQRLQTLNDTRNVDYVDIEKVQDEMRDARRMFTKKGYPVVDVTCSSIEETAARIIYLYQGSGYHT